MARNPRFPLRLLPNITPTLTRKLSALFTKQTSRDERVPKSCRSGIRKSVLGDRDHCTLQKLTTIAGVVFPRGKKDGTFDRLLDELRGDLRQAEGPPRQPSAALLDSQLVQTTEQGGRTTTTPVSRSPAASSRSWSTRSGLPFP